MICYHALMLIDTHIHIDAQDCPFSASEVLRQAQAEGIMHLIVPGVRLESWDHLLALSRNNPAISIAPGLHPFYADRWSPTAHRRLAELASSPGVIAIGEIGLDGIAGPTADVQEQTFREQLEIACAAELPILLHSRKTTQRTFAILDEFSMRGLSGVWHGFSGSLETAEKLLAAGFKIGVGTVLLNPTARKLPELIQQLPLEAFMLETDFPYRADHPKALTKVAEMIAQLKNVSVAQVAEVTSRTAAQFFTLDLPS
jgi:TatD DNase family protein